MWSGVCWGRSFSLIPVLACATDSNCIWTMLELLLGNGKTDEKTKGRSLDVLSAIKRSIIVVQGTILCLAHALIIPMSRVNGDPKYKSFRNGTWLKRPVENLLSASGVDLTNGGSFKELEHFHLSSFGLQNYCVRWFKP